MPCESNQPSGEMQGGFTLSQEQARLLRERLPRARDAGRVTLANLRAKGERFALILVAVNNADKGQAGIASLREALKKRGAPCVTAADLATATEPSSPMATEAWRPGALRLWHPRAERGPYGLLWSGTDRFSAPAWTLDTDVQETLAEIEANWCGDPGRISCQVEVEFLLSASGRRIRRVRLARPTERMNEDAADNFDGSSRSSLGWK